ncbi:MAG TPA: M48 family metalloprotease [Candidatus Polarisedimenticolia bacterium]|nr:M48 family metalloprotease [Candidatus Polarisedimenticolia bacterium]
MKHPIPVWGVTFLLLAAASAGPAAGESADVSGYLEFKKGDVLIVDGQRVRVGPKTRFKGKGRARTLQKIPLGYEIEASGERGSDGSIQASSLSAQPNRKAFLESDVLAATDAAESSYIKARKVYETGPEGKEVVVGTLHDKGPQVDRARTILDRLLPPYVDRRNVRLYVVDNDEWNAMAMANHSIYVFSGLVRDMDDDELAIVIGHEIAHATHEHSRRQARQGLFGGLAGSAVSAGAELLDSPLARGAVQGAASLGVITFGNVYSRDYEDQADRVGLRYVYEAGYDHRKAPGLWRKFARKYGDQGKVANFFFGDHSVSSKRADTLQKEIERNYTEPAKDPPSGPGRPR